MCEQHVSAQQRAETAIPTTMSAVVAYAPGDYRLEEVSSPEISAGEILIKVEACGICAGDLKAYHGAPSFWGDETQPAYIKAPMIPGHEFIGRIVAISEEVEGFAVGDRVISEQIVPCWDCRFCKSGQYWMCQKHDVYGFQNNVNGGMAQYMKFPKEAINFKVPEDLPIEKAVLIEPYACSFHAVQRANIQLGDTVVIAGAGTLGLGMIGAAKKAGAETLVVLDMKDERLELAKKFGADIVLNPSKVDTEAEIKAMTEGYGCDVYIEATGHPKSVEQGLLCIRNLGRFVEFSVFKDPVTVDWSIISDRKELDVLGSHLGPYCYPLVIKGIVDGSLPTEGVVTHFLPLSEFEKGFELVSSGKDALKVVLVP
ncbi:putative Alcohol dehydrogenase zinc-binding domain protein [Vibrio nigripulchritudo MADA3029]|uniref:MDR/zinc-dependent alcohol dehydrogenase-like family protein n=1 Tax=Vibrio nigripulchritudo TaxID=28173 RepID=UPI0003B1BB24|nr:alcohol dehydrogenase catalytic domain-containing protein [Vibrio nigripulchritudo]CCN50139.1 putative Alcohol dehydrogenase zinc-binding domain protein [Vibrio nigripulchritudo MADA3020]CCN55381.1 putative Alcohol dehydrogenase zinc-binding domain protein [Vibrio nigripulchritudo MADA3021]CCN57234.1 putative Alcohol dehydrogenase zinc-binding domain protein [Vibrio nigripulchritudo MADA3029]